MKNFLIFTFCLLLSFPLFAGKQENKECVMTGDEKTGFTLEVDDESFSIPCALDTLLARGWTISEDTPYFLEPLVGEDYYEIRTSFSLKEGFILSQGSVIRLLEKDGVLLEVTIFNPFEKKVPLEAGVVDSIIVFYDEMHKKIKLDGKDLEDLGHEYLLERYPSAQGWSHSLSYYDNHPEFGILREHYILNYLESCQCELTVYYDLEGRAFKLMVQDQRFLY